jgi:hypothetical protein
MLFYEITAQITNMNEKEIADLTNADNVSKFLEKLSFYHDSSSKDCQILLSSI